MKKIVITFHKGQSSIEAFGFTGGECLKATKSIEEALGKVDKRTMKSGSGGSVTEKAMVSA
jgi:Protein of unknown function (DUF2997)